MGSKNVLSLVLALDLFLSSFLRPPFTRQDMTNLHLSCSHSYSSCLPPNKSYSDLVDEALLCLHKRSGSSLQAIKQYIYYQYPDLHLRGSYLRAALKKAITNKRIMKVKGSFKMPSSQMRMLMRRRSVLSSVSVYQAQLKTSAAVSVVSHAAQARAMQRSKLSQPKISPSICTMSFPSPPPSPSKRNKVLSRPNLRSSNIKRRLRSFARRGIKLLFV